MKDLFTGLGLRVQGHLKIYEYTSRSDYLDQRPARKLLDRRNAVHKDNASILVIQAITNQPISNICYMVFGNGGTTIDETGTISFKPANDAGINADLYNPVFFQMVDDRLGALTGNQMAVRHIGNTLFTDVDIRALIDVNEPFGQRSSNTVNNITESTTFGPLYSQFAFDEIGLKLADSRLITHVIFTPILKTASSLIEVVYTLRIVVDNAGVNIINDQPALNSVEVVTAVGTPDYDIVTPDRSFDLDGVQAVSAAGIIYTPTQLAWRIDPSFGTGIGAPYIGNIWGGQISDVDTGFESFELTSVAQSTYLPDTGTFRVRAKTYFTKFIVTTYHIDALYMRIVFDNSTLSPVEVSTTTDITDTDAFLATETSIEDIASNKIDPDQPILVHMEIRAAGTVGLGGGNIFPCRRPVDGDPIDDAYFIVEWWE